MQIELIKKYFENKCSPEEVSEIFEWVDNPEASEDISAEMAKAWAKIKVKSSNHVKWNEKLEKIHEQIEMEELYGTLIPEKTTKKRAFRKDRPLKEGRKLPDKISKRKSLHKMYWIAATVVLLVLIGTLIQKPTKEKDHSLALEQIERRTEPGQKQSFHLEDGTKVILNSGSALSYSDSFGHDERLVTLSGEAFFEVTEDASRPFRVITGSVSTTALGTAFNINAFSANGSIEISLVHGKVLVESKKPSGKPSLMELNPGEMATVLKSNYEVSKSSFDFNEKISWKDGIIFFRDARYHKVMTTLENWYGVTIIENNFPTKEWKFSGKFEDENLENILIALQFGHEFEYAINGNKVNLNF